MTKTFLPTSYLPRAISLQNNFLRPSAQTVVLRRAAFACEHHSTITSRSEANSRVPSCVSWRRRRDASTVESDRRRYFDLPRHNGFRSLQIRSLRTTNTLKQDKDPQVPQHNSPRPLNTTPPPPPTLDPDALRQPSPPLQQPLNPPQPQRQQPSLTSTSKTTQPNSPSPLPTLLSTLPPSLKNPLLRTIPQYENIYTLPNFLTFSRLVSAPIIGYLILHDSHLWAAGLFFYAGVTDLVDGWIARRWNQQTVVGSVVDPLADKALMTILTVCLAVKGALPLWLATLILGRDVSLGIAAIYYRYASLPPPKTFLRYWDFSLPSAEVHPTTISKYNTFLQLLLIGATTVLPVVGPAVEGAAQALSTNVSSSGLDIGQMMHAAQLIVAGTTVWSGASYLYARKAVKILGDGTKEEKKKILRWGRAIIAASFVGCGIVAWVLESGIV